MKIDLAVDQKKVRRYILQRVRDYSIYVNDGPGQDEDPITLVTLGYEIGQAGYIALVFDTRPGAESDGQWTAHLDEGTTQLGFPRWNKLIDACCKGKPAELCLLGGQVRKLTPRSTDASVAKLFGKMLLETMTTLRDEGKLDSLPLVPGALLDVEEISGHWSGAAKLRAGTRGEVEKEEPLETREKRLVQRIKKLPVDEQIVYWIKQLELYATGEPHELPSMKVNDEVHTSGVGKRQIHALGKPAVVPMLKLILRLVVLPAYDGDAPKFPLRSTAAGELTGDVMITLLKPRRDATPEVEGLLQQIVHRSCKANAGRRRWSSLPYLAADQLYEMFKGYPEPEEHETTYRLMNTESFMKTPKR